MRTLPDKIAECCKAKSKNGKRNKKPPGLNHAFLHRIISSMLGWQWRQPDNNLAGSRFKAPADHWCDHIGPL
jgi:hypothetical protein